MTNIIITVKTTHDSHYLPAEYQSGIMLSSLLFKDR